LIRVGDKVLYGDKVCTVYGINSLEEYQLKDDMGNRHNDIDISEIRRVPMFSKNKVKAKRLKKKVGYKFDN
jgi:hypothetical protein